MKQESKNPTALAVGVVRRRLEMELDFSNRSIPVGTRVEDRTSCSRGY